MSGRFSPFSRRHSRTARRARAFVPYALLSALILQLAAPVHAEGTVSSPAPVSSPPSSDPNGLGGPSVSEFRAAFASRGGRPVTNVDQATFNRYVAAHSSRGRLLTGPALAQAVSAANADAQAKPRAAAGCDSLPAAARPACRDSARHGLREAAMPARARVEPSVHDSGAPAFDSIDTADRDDPVRRTLREREARRVKADGGDSLDEGLQPSQWRAKDHARSEEEDEAVAEHTSWFVNVFSDMRGGGSWGGDEWAAVLYVVIGVVVVGAFLVYGLQTLAELAINKDAAPLFVETGLRLSYSGKAFGDPNGGGELYRDAYLAGLRFAIGFDRPGMGIGIAAEGGYIDVFLRSPTDPANTFDFRGGYLVAGPMVRFGHNDPWSMSLEFLNGTSTHASIGWISKSRMSVQHRFGDHLLVGGQLGAVFYDLHFLDGLGLRKGNFNRDLSLVYGLETGWEF